MLATMRNGLLRLPPGTYTLGEVLREAMLVAVERPERLNMSYWIFMHPSDTSTIRRMREKTHRVPECGTVACLAGWGALLVRDRKIYSGSDFLELFGFPFEATVPGNRLEWMNDLYSIFNGGGHYSGQSREQAAWLKQEVEQFLEDWGDTVSKYTVTVK